MKYYYTDPLTAAWMAKHFGMRFIAFDDAELKWCKEFSCYFHPNESEYEGQFWDDKYYIHPDSISIVSAQVNDIIWNKYYTLPMIVVASPEKMNGQKIIARNGTPFMWPEIEE